MAETVLSITKTRSCFQRRAPCLKSEFSCALHPLYAFDDIDNATPDIVIGSTLPEPEEDVVYEHEVESGGEEAEAAPQKEKKSVAFAGLEDEYDEEEARREFEEGGGLPEQPENPDFSSMTPLSPEIINRQATINIDPFRVSDDCLRTSWRNIYHIRLGCASAPRLAAAGSPPPGCYRSFKSDKEIHPKCQQPDCEGRYNLVRHVSFVDCPGHDILMSTMLSVPQPRTQDLPACVKDHEELNHVIILQNKVDLMRERGSALEPENPAGGFIRGTIAPDHHDYISHIILKDFMASPRLIVIRSFDVNKPGAEIDDLKGGVAGGSILTGVFKIGDEIEIRRSITCRTAMVRSLRAIFSTLAIIVVLRTA
ncbi:hypothetical protein E0198_004401 [Clavispora lusitaniae]|nr:hypothetical protein E0198_004401 [Clavispora lusitaniae]